MNWKQKSLGTATASETLYDYTCIIFWFCHFVFGNGFSFQDCSFVWKEANWMLKVQHYVAEKYYFFCILWISLGSHLAWYCDILANHNCYILFRLHAKDYWKEFSWYSEGGKWNYLQWHQWIWKFWTFISRKQRCVVSWTHLCVLINFHLILFYYGWK